jgi:DNA-binding winged helix-turn-helix (wHTH) protein/tetratricopeptide (TPR) repeat protein
MHTSSCISNESFDAPRHGRIDAISDNDALPDRVEFAHCVVDKGRRELWVSGTRRKLEPKVFDLLVYLIEHNDRVVGREELLETVWKRKFLTDSVVARAVMKVRRAIDDNSDDRPLIQTQHRVGYRMVCLVRPLQPSFEPAPPPAQAERGDLIDPAYARLTDSDPFIAQALARCVEAVAEQRFDAALKYIEVCIDEGGAPLPLAVEHVARLAAVMDPSTPTRAGALLLEARVRHDKISEALLLASLANYHHATGTQDSAAELADSALSLVGTTERSEKFVEILLLRSEISLSQRQFGAAQRHLSHAMSLAQALNSRRLEAAAIRHSAAILMHGGDHAGAIDALARANALCHEVGVRNGDLASSLLRLAVILKELGNIKEAISVAQDSVGYARKAGTITTAALSLLLLVSLHLLHGDPSAAVAVRRDLDTPRMRANLVARAVASMADGCLVWRVGRLEEACQAFGVANPVLRGFGQFWTLFALRLNVLLFITAGKFEEARGFIAEMESRGGLEHDPVLHAASRFCSAALLHAQGEHEQAYDRLAELAASAPVGQVRAEACLCAAWLSCERGDLARTTGWLADAGEWLRQYPRAVMLEARHCYARDDFDGALLAHGAYLARTPVDQVTPYEVRLHVLYREAAASRSRIDLPIRPLFLTLRS